MSIRQGDKIIAGASQAPSDVYTKSQINELLENKQDVAQTGDYYITDKVLADAMATKAQKADTLSGYGITDAYTKTETESKISQSVSTKADASDVYTKSEIDEKLSGEGIDLSSYLSKSEAETTYATKTENEAKVDKIDGYSLISSEKLTQIDTNKSDIATNAYNITTKISSSEKGVASGVAPLNSDTKISDTYLNNPLANPSGHSGQYLKSTGSSNEWASVREIPEVTEETSGKVLKSDGLTYYWGDTSEGDAFDYEQAVNKPQINSIELVGNKTLSDLGIQAAGDYAYSSTVNELSSSKQDKLVAGNNITIIDNVISSTGGGSVSEGVYTQENLVAGDNIEIKEVLAPNILDDDSILCLHFENNVQDSSKYASVSDSSGLTAEYNDTAKFGSASAYSVMGSVVSNKFTEISNALTIDFWANKTLNANGAGAQVNLGYFSFAAYGTDGQPQFYLQLAGNTTHWPYTYESSLLTQNWNHLAGVFEQNQDGYIVARFFVNGKKILEETTSQQSLFSADDSDLNSLSFVAGMAIDEFRVSKKAVWTEDFTPLTEPYTVTDNGSKKSINAIVPEGIYTETNLLGGKDIEIVPEPVEGGIDEYTIGMWHFDTDGKDEITGTELSYFTSDRIVNSDFKFGTGCLYSNYAQTIGTFSERNLSYTVDMWYKHVSEYTNFSIGINCDSYSSTDSPTNGYRLIVSASSITLQHSRYYENNTTFNTVSFPFYSSATWHHIAAQKINNEKIQVFVDGNLLIEQVIDESLVYGSGVVIKGQQYIDELRLSNTIRWTEDFEPPTQPYRIAEPTGNYVVNFTGEAGQSGKNIGEVYYSQSSLASDNAGALPLFTGETIASADTIYPDFYAWVESHTELQTTAEEYESALTTYGECPKYVVSDGSLRLPKLTNYIKMANTTEGITQSEAGLPNLEGWFTLGNNSGRTFGVDGVLFKKTDKETSYIAGYNGIDSRAVEFNASEYNPTYGKSETVTPAHTTLYPWVFAYNASVPASTAQAAEFQEGLSGKADTNLGNIPSNYDYVVERYDDEKGNWYEVWKSGWLRQGGITTDTSNNHITITFLKPFANVNYSISKNNNFYADVNNSARVFNFYSRTTTSADTWASNTVNAGQGFSWIAEGQGA